MKTMLTLLAILIVAVSLTMFLPEARAKEIDIGVMISGSYDRATWRSGSHMSPTGTSQDNWIGFDIAGQMKYTRWDFQPTIEVGYRKESFNMSTWQAIQKADPTYLRFLIGLTYAHPDLSVYLLGGITKFDANPKLIEKYPYQPHKGSPSDIVLTFKIGAYKLWDVWKVKVGPEVSLSIYPTSIGFDRCRKFRSSQLVPNVGLRIQW